MKKLLNCVFVLLKIIAPVDFSVRRQVAQPNSTELNYGKLFIVVGKNNSPKWAVFRCPGNCGNIIRLPLTQSNPKSWRCHIDFLGRATIVPSIRQLDACKAHFWIEKGIVIWCKDNLCGGRTDFLH